MSRGSLRLHGHASRRVEISKRLDEAGSHCLSQNIFGYTYHTILSEICLRCLSSMKRAREVAEAEIVSLGEDERAISSRPPLSTSTPVTWLLRLLHTGFISDLCLVDFIFAIVWWKILAGVCAWFPHLEFSVRANFLIFVVTVVFTSRFHINYEGRIRKSVRWQLWRRASSIYEKPWRSSQQVFFSRFSICFLILE